MGKKDNKIVSDVVVDLQYGDSGKGKVAYHLAKHGNYTHVMRYNGGANAGHTVYHEGVKFITHSVPVGVLFGVDSIIGPGCVLNPESFFEEVKALNDQGIVTKDKLFIAKNTHIITDEHLNEDSDETRIGTTRRGIGPVYRDKYARIGIRAEDIAELKDYVVDVHDLLHSGGDKVVLGEGAQGFGLDIDWGDYPYVTSSHPTVAGAIMSGLPPNSIRDVWGVVKAYETYVGAKDFQPEGEVFEKIQKAGKEFGATTGRARQTNWMDTDLVTRGALHNSITKLVVNKCDILRDVGAWGLIENGQVTKYNSEAKFNDAVLKMASGFGLSKGDIYFSESPERI